MAEAPGAAVPIRTRGLYKHFGRRAALRGVDLEVRRAETVTIFGANGAGKTTLVRCLATLARATRGHVWIDGVDVRRSTPQIRRHLGVVSHSSFLYGALTARENLSFYAGMFGVPSPADRVEAMAAAVGLSDRLDDPVRTFSRGLVQRCSIARALVHDPEILLLDEPFAGLDPVAADALRVLLAEARGAGRTVLVTSHDLDRGHDLADRVLIMSRGSVVFDSPAADLSGGELGERYRALSPATRA